MQLRHPHPFLEPHENDNFVSFAHRGGAPHLPENSLAAFSHAVGIGFRYIETDVQITKDGTLVAFHDSNLSRTCGVDAEISSMTVAELSSARIADREPIPLLSEVFDAFPDVRINIDAKSDETVDPLIDFLRSPGNLERTCVGSFSHSRLQQIRAAFGQRVCTSASPREVALWMAGFSPDGPSCYQVPLKQLSLSVVTRRRIERSHRRGDPVHVWTIDEPVVMQGLMDSGVHGIMTDDAAELKRVAERNLMWR